MQFANQPNERRMMDDESLLLAVWSSPNHALPPAQNSSRFGFGDALIIRHLPFATVFASPANINVVWCARRDYVYESTSE